MGDIKKKLGFPAAGFSPKSSVSQQCRGEMGETVSIGFHLAVFLLKP